jgi:tetratricopeptide (TPR) repeat protein
MVRILQDSINAPLLSAADDAVARHHFDEAESIYKRIISSCEKELGRLHPSVAVAQEHLANLYRAQNRYLDAEPLLIRTFKIKLRCLGRENLDVALALRNLTEVWELLGKMEEAAKARACASDLLVRQLSAGST